MTTPHTTARSQTDLRELALVLGVPLAISAVLQFAAYTPDNAFHFGPGRLLRLLVVEVGLGIPIIWLLRSRGWRLENLTLRFEAKDVVRALGVWLLGYLISLIGWLLVYIALGDRAYDIADRSFGGSAPLLLIVIACLVNPVFEELLWLGYLLNGPGHRHRYAAALLSIVARTFVHSYQGWSALISIMPLGAWFTWYYYKRGRLWPVIIAHGIYDLTSISLAVFGRPAG